MNKNIYYGLLGLLSLPSVEALDFRGKLALEGTAFYKDGFSADQENFYGAVEFSPDVYKEWDNDLSLTFNPFMRLDQHDDERSHFDLRDLSLLKVNGDYEFKLGLSSVFWGVTEFNHLVDVINQTDFVENIDGEDKLGQPMLHLTAIKDYGTFEFFYLPAFRERTFAGKEGRLRMPLVVDTDAVTYESGAEEFHSDFAFRWSHNWEAYDFALSYFKGTSRDPDLRFSAANPSVLTPHYYQMDQIGFEFQAIFGDWAFKMENIYRDSDIGFGHATTGGFEYTRVGVLESEIDLGWLMEVINVKNPSVVNQTFTRTLFLGQRWIFNDVQSSEILAGYSSDSDMDTQVFLVEASRRINDHLKLTLESRFFVSAPHTSIFNALQDDDYSRLELAWYF